MNKAENIVPGATVTLTLTTPKVTLVCVGTIQEVYANTVRIHWHTPSNCVDEAPITQLMTDTWEVTNPMNTQERVQAAKVRGFVFVDLPSLEGILLGTVDALMVRTHLNEECKPVAFLKEFDGYKLSSLTIDGLSGQLRMHIVNNETDVDTATGPRYPVEPGAPFDEPQDLPTRRTVQR